MPALTMLPRNNPTTMTAMTIKTKSPMTDAQEDFFCLFHNENQLTFPRPFVQPNIVRAASSRRERLDGFDEITDLIRLGQKAIRLDRRVGINVFRPPCRSRGSFSAAG